MGDRQLQLQLELLGPKLLNGAHLLGAAVREHLFQVEHHLRQCPQGQRNKTKIGFGKLTVVAEG
jgi:hypothetical protein